ncbi:glycosyltransferase [bacterium]|nr:glycosyltransferase [bacterium]MCI0604260.1 glycosyltransferase [bacterium]
MSAPTFSIVIPTYGRPSLLQECLNSISRLVYPRECFEVIVVDDGGPEPLDCIVDNLRSQLNVKLIRQFHAGPAAARNRGASAARNEYVVFIDDDCIPHEDWLQKFAGRFQITPDHGIGGRVINRLQENVYLAASQLLADFLYSYYNGNEPGTAQFLSSNNLSFPVKSFFEIGGFNTVFPGAAAEDRELCMRWLQSKRLLTYEPEAKVSHGYPISLRGFWKKHFNYGYGAALLHDILKERNGASIPVEPPSFYWDLLRHPSRQGASRSAILAALVAISQIANASGYFSHKVRGIRN